MSGKIDAEIFALCPEVLHQRPLRTIRKFRIRCRAFDTRIQHIEKASLRARLLLCESERPLQREFDIVEIPRPVERRICGDERIEGARPDQILHRPLVDDRRPSLAVLADGYHRTETDAEIHESLVRAVLLALSDNRIRNTATDALDAGQTVADRLFPLHRSESGKGGVHVRRLDLKPHRLSLCYEARELIEVSDFRGNLGAHELCRIVRLQVARLIGDPCIAHGMGLVERVGRKLLPVSPDLLDELLGDLLILPLVDAELWIVETSLDELRLQLVHDVHELLAHGLAELVGLSAREPGKKAREQHHLFLIHRYAVRILQVLLHQRMVVRDRLLALLSVDEGGNVVHRAGTVQRVHCDKVGEPFRLKRDEPFLHAVGFELKKSSRLTASEKLVSLLVVVGDVVGIDVNPVKLLDERNALLLDRQRLEAEEVHLEKADRLHEVSVILRGEKRLSDRRHYRKRIDERVTRNDDAAGMYARLADGTV